MERKDWHRLFGLVLTDFFAGSPECRRGSDLIRVLVLRQLPKVKRNAPLHLLSAAPELVAYGSAHYRRHSPDTSTLMYRLFSGFEREGIAVPYTMEDFRRDFRRDYAKELLKDLTPEETRELIKNLSPEVLGAIEKELKRRKEKTARGKQRKKS
jgi:hypothetical protein